MWDAPGMLRIKIPLGRLTAEQLDVLAELAEEYSDSILHVTTRQDIQLHFVHIDDTPDLMRRLAAVGITTREACGNSVRNVTACPFAGVCNDRGVRRHAVRPRAHLLPARPPRHAGLRAQVQDRVLRLQARTRAGLTNFHDIGAIATVREVDGKVQRGFEFYVGGGLGAVPQQAKLLDEFVPEEELLPLAQAVCRVFARLGERKNRARARLKFLVQKLGIEEFRRWSSRSAPSCRPDPRWTAFLDRPRTQPTRSRCGPGAPLARRRCPGGFDALAARPTCGRSASRATWWPPSRCRSATSPRRRRAQLADLARRYTGDTMRTTVEQNLVLRWVPRGGPARRSTASSPPSASASPGADTIVDITACPGTDTCKLGISSSRGLAAELREQPGARAEHDCDAGGRRRLHIKVSGCFNSCGQHHVADIGFLGVSRNVGGRRVPHFQLVVGGEWENNGGSYGLAIGAVPSQARAGGGGSPDRAVAARAPAGRAACSRSSSGPASAKIKEALEDLRHVPSYEEDRSFYSDWGDPREYTIGDMGVGECAGEVVSAAEFGLAASEREVFEAQLSLEAGNPARAAELAYRAMLSAAKALVQVQYSDVSDDAASIVTEFRTRFHDTQMFDPGAGARFAAFLLRAHEAPLQSPSHERAHQQIEEAQLFIEAAHACHDRLQGGPPAAAVPRVVQEQASA